MQSKQVLTLEEVRKIAAAAEAEARGGQADQIYIQILDAAWATAAADAHKESVSSDLGASNE